MGASAERQDRQKGLVGWNVTGIASLFWTGKNPEKLRTKCQNFFFHLSRASRSWKKGDGCKTPDNVQKSHPSQPRVCSTRCSTRVKSPSVWPLGRSQTCRVKGGRRGVLAEAKVEEKIVPTARPTAVQPLAEAQRRRPHHSTSTCPATTRNPLIYRDLHVIYTWSDVLVMRGAFESNNG